MDVLNSRDVEREHFTPEQPLLQGCDGAERSGVDRIIFEAGQYLVALAEWSWERSSNLLLYGSEGADILQ